MGGIGVGAIFLAVGLGEVTNTVPIPEELLLNLVVFSLSHAVAVLELEILLSLLLVFSVELFLFLLLQFIDPVEVLHQVALFAHILLSGQLALLILNPNLFVEVARERVFQLFLGLLLLEVVLLQLS